MLKTLILPTLLLTLLSACASLNETTPVTVANESTETDAAPPKNDYPTRDRVDYVLECVAKHGGLSYINQYACGCKIDKIAEKLTFAQYEGARTFVQMQKTPGENGAAFRAPELTKDARGLLKEAEADAEKACFVH
jgi:ABC-type Fe3+-hydroxamate transport system substrate-binding protein